MRSRALVNRLEPGLRDALLAERGRLGPGVDLAALIDADPERFVAQVQHRTDVLHALFPERGRTEALLALCRALDVRMPESEYVLPEHTLEALLDRARGSHGRRISVRGGARHKGRVGDGVERLLVGAKVLGMNSDHPAAEIKSVPVRGDQVVERVKLGVISERSNPLEKCDSILFVFVEQRGADHFVRGHHHERFDHARWETMWRDGFLVETAAGSPRRPSRGLYLTPRWFRARGIWPQAG